MESFSSPSYLLSNHKSGPRIILHLILKTKSFLIHLSLPSVFFSRSGKYFKFQFHFSIKINKESFFINLERTIYIAIHKHTNVKQSYHSNILIFLFSCNKQHAPCFFFIPFSESYPNTYLAAQPLFFNVLLRCFTFIISSLQSPRSFSCRLRSLTLAQTSSSSLMSNGVGDSGGFWQKVTLLVLFQIYVLCDTSKFFVVCQLFCSSFGVYFINICC